MSEDMIKFMIDAKNYAYGRVPNQYEEDFQSFAVMRHLERGTHEFRKIMADFYRETFGDSRNKKGAAQRLASHVSIDVVEIAAPFNDPEVEFARKPEPKRLPIEPRFTHFQMAQLLSRIHKIPEKQTVPIIEMKPKKEKKAYCKTPEWTEYRRANRIGRFKNMAA